MLSFEGLKIGYGQRILLEGVSARLRAGRLTAILGRNGSGKSTLIRTICGLERPLGGHIFINADALAGLEDGRAADWVRPRQADASRAEAGQAGSGRHEAACRHETANLHEAAGRHETASQHKATGQHKAAVRAGATESERDITSLNRNELARLISFVGTERIRIPNLRCRELVELGRAPHTGSFGRLTAADRKAVNRALDMVGMADYSERPLETLSDGECQRVMIARALAQDTPIMLLDEPTAWLDVPGRHSTVALLRDLATEAGKSVIFSTHELDLAERFADDILLFDPPRLITGPTGSIVASGEIERVFGLTRPADRTQPLPPRDSATVLPENDIPAKYE